LKKLVETVRIASEGKTRLFIQLIDFMTIRRRPDPDKFLSRFLTISDSHRHLLNMPDANDVEVRDHLLALSPAQRQTVLTVKEWEDMCFGYRERVTDTHIDEVAELPKVLPLLFSDAAKRAELAGFDGVELHYAHAYTMASFLSATNSRTDGYGGSREGRVRLPLEVYQAVRKNTGKGFVVGCRMMRFLSRVVDSMMQLFLPNNFLRLEWIFSPFLGAASLMMLSNQRLVGQPIPTQGRAAMSVCRVIFPIVSGPSGAILIPLPIYGIVWLPKTSWCPVSQLVEFIALCKPNLF
jgi:hypothetical protein